MHGAHPQKPQSTSLTHSLIHFPQERRRGESFAAFSVSRETNRQTQGRAEKLASSSGEGGLSMVSRRGQALFHAHGLGQAVRVSRETNRKTHGRTRKLASPFGGGGLSMASRRGQKSPHTGYTGPFVEKGKSFFTFPGQHFPFGPLCGTMSREHNACATHSAGGLLLPAVSGQARANDRQRQNATWTGRMRLWVKSLPSPTRRAVWARPPRR